MSTDPLKTRFDEVDRDGNGAINEAEFSQLLNALGAGYSDAQVHAAFADIDANTSGTIDLEEFRKWWAAH